MHILLFSVARFRVEGMKLYGANVGNIVLQFYATLSRLKKGPHAQSKSEAGTL